MHRDGHVDSSQLLNEDQPVDVKWRFFFMCNVAKSGRFIVDQTDASGRWRFMNQRLIWAVDQRWRDTSNGRAQFLYKLRCSLTEKLVLGCFEQI